MTMKRPKRTAQIWGLLVLSVLAISPTHVLAQGQSAREGNHSLSQVELAAILHGQPMTLDDAVRISLIASRPLGSALTAYEKALGAVSEVNSAFLPRSVWALKQPNLTAQIPSTSAL